MTWIVSLDPINSGDTCKIELENNLNFITLEDIMFGDVWFCSGQSNMGWAMLGNYYLVCLECI
jgi:sialate O-acetylesterase